MLVPINIESAIPSAISYTEVQLRDCLEDCWRWPKVYLSTDSIQSVPKLVFQMFVRSDLKAPGEFFKSKK